MLGDCLRAPVIWILLLVICGPVSAEMVFQDPAGDVATDTISGAPGLEGFEHIDLVSLALVEDPEGFWITLGLDALDSSFDRTTIREGIADVPFSAAGTPYLLQLRRDFGDFYHYVSDLYRLVEDDAPELLLRFSDWTDTYPTVDRAANQLTTFVPRALLRDDANRTLAPGQTLVFDRVVSRSSATSGLAVDFVPIGGAGRAADAMPDGEAAAVVPVRYGVASRDLVVESPLPFRSSNGAAATYLYQFNVTNLGASTALEVIVNEAPPSWQVHILRPSIKADQGQTIAIAVAVTVPFRHQHGDVDWATLELHDEGGLRGGIPFGIRFTEAPRPTAHHATLWLETRQVQGGLGAAQGERLANDSGWPGFLTTQHDDLRATGKPYTGQPSDAPTWVSQPTVTWRFMLRPQLDIGLDLDLAGLARLELPLSVERLAVPGQLQARVGVMTPGDGPDEPLQGQGMTDLVRFEPLRVDITDQVQTVQMQGAPIGTAHVTPATTQADLVLEIQLLADTPQTYLVDSLPRIESGGWLQVPLDEYVDVVDMEFSHGQAPSLRVNEPVLRAEPGRTVKWEVSYEPADAVVTVTGDDGFALVAGKDGKATVLATVPHGALIGDAFTAFVVAEAPGGQNTLLLGVQAADTDLDTHAYADIPPAEATPGSSLAVLGCVVLLLAARRRGRFD